MIEGATITNVRRMTEEELDREGWDPGHHAPPPVLELSTDEVLYPSMDSEGNGPGALFGVGSDDDLIVVNPEE